MNSKFAVVIFALFCSAFLISTAVAGSTPALDKNIVDQVNNNKGSSWKAGFNSMFANMTLVQAKRKLVSILPTADTFKQSPPSSLKLKLIKALPESYDVTKMYPTCAVGIETEPDHCGNSVAVVANAAGNRYCILQSKKGITVSSELSVQYALSCDVKSADVCCNEELADTIAFVQRYGLPSKNCFRFNPMCPACPRLCDDRSPLDIKRVIKVNTTQLHQNADNLMLDVMTYGYAIAGMKVYQDFFSYQGGVYSHQTGSFVENHTVNIIGWGQMEDGTKYWIIQNNWGVEWGMSGRALIKRNVNECDIEKTLISFEPGIFKTVKKYLLFAPTQDRTVDLRLIRPLLYRLRFLRRTERM